MPEDEPPGKRPRYQWPWFALAAVLLFLALAVIWMMIEIRKVKQERDFNAPLPASTR